MEASGKTPESGRGTSGRPALQGLRVTVMGLGLFGGGVGAARYFARRGARVTVTDVKEAKPLAPSIKALECLPVTFHLGGHRDEDFTQTDLLVVSPAVDKRKSGFVRMAQAAGIPITSEMNVFMEMCRAPTVAVTGSNGKSTTMSLLGAMLALARPTRLGGNIGISLLDESEKIGPEELVVLELSSFQLEDLGLIGRSPQGAVVTCISPNHLDRHGVMAGYIAAKKNILRFQARDGVAVLNEDDPEVRTWGADARGRVVRYSATQALREGVFAEGDTVVLRLGDREERVDLAGRLKLRGRHNLANVLAAAAGARLFGASTDHIAAAVEAFRPLAHRLEPVGEWGGVLFVNDSKATTPLAAQLAIEAFSRPVIIIAGGYDKHTDPTPMAETIRVRAKAAILLGATAGALAGGIGQGGPPVEMATGIDDAVRRAVAHAAPGDVVLLSPGHASWDMFENYEQRGDLFRRAAERFAKKGFQV